MIYGMYAVHNKTQNVYRIDGGNSLSAFSMSTSIPHFFLSHNGYGNPYMNQHYANSLYYGENAIQKGMRITMEVIEPFIGGNLGYFIILFMVQIFKLFFCAYKRVNIHSCIFDIL